jgi:hypothetical protein
MSEWKPIDTAPSNVSVLVFIPDAEHYGPGIYRGLYVDMGEGRAAAHWMTTARAMGRDCGVGCMPTHWMPLPEPPQ